MVIALLELFTVLKTSKKDVFQDYVEIMYIFIHV